MAAVKALQQWCKIQCDGYRDVSITNMTTSFRDGLAFCALIHKHRPDLIDFDSLSKENIYENNQRAFQVAEQELGIPALLDAEDMVAMKVPDRLSILTYVSQYYNYFHGRSPIGGMAGVKRPAEESIEESPGKKNQPVTAKVFGSPKPAVENKTLTPANEYKTPKPVTGNITAKLPTENKAPKPANENKREVLAERVNKSSMSSSCSVCNQHVHLVQRHIVDGKLYHRNCFKCKECSSILLSGTYKTGKEPGTFVCKSHSSTQKPLTTQSTQITETPQKTQSSFFSKSTNATPTEQKETVVGSGKGALTTNTTKLSWLSNKSDRTPTRVFTPATPTPIPQFTPASTPKATTSTASTTKTESTPKTSTIKTELTPKTESTPKALTTKTESTPKALTTKTESTPKALTTKTESTPKALTTKTESTPKALTTKTESTPKALTTKTESTPKALTTKTESTQKMSTAKTELTPKVGSTPETSTMKTPSNPRTLLESPKPASHSVQKNQEARKRFFEPSSSPSSAAPANKSFSPDTSTASVSPGQVKTPTSQNTTTPSTAGASKGRVLLRVGDWAKVTDKEKEKENEKEKAKAVIGKLVTDEKNNSSSSQSPGLKANGSNVSPVESSGKGPSGRVRLKPLDATVESTAGTASWLNAKDKTSSRPASTLSTNSKENVAASDWRSMLKPVSKPANSTESTGSPTKKLEAASSPQSSDQGISQTSISTPSKTSMSTGVKDPKTPSARPQNNGSTPSDSRSMSPGTETHKLHKPDYIPKDEIMKELKDIETNLNELEMRGIELEKQLRQCDDEGEEDTLMNDLMVDWFNLIRNKQVYMRRESELVYIARTQDLEEEQPSVEAELRRLMEKPEHLKTFHDRRREKELMDKLVGIVNDRNAIVEGLDEDRLREEEEDEQLKRMMQNLDVKKNKVKGKSSISRWFSMRSKRTSVED